MADDYAARYASANGIRRRCMKDMLHFDARYFVNAHHRTKSACKILSIVHSYYAATPRIVFSPAVLKCLPMITATTMPGVRLLIDRLSRDSMGLCGLATFLPGAARAYHRAAFRWPHSLLLHILIFTRSL